MSYPPPLLFPPSFLLFPPPPRFNFRILTVFKLILTLLRCFPSFLFFPQLVTYILLLSNWFGCLHSLLPKLEQLSVYDSFGYNQNLLWDAYFISFLRFLHTIPLPVDLRVQFSRCLFLSLRAFRSISIKPNWPPAGSRRRQVSTPEEISVERTSEENITKAASAV